MASIIPLPIVKAAWLAGWDHRLKLTIDHDDIAVALVDFPVRVFLSTASGINGDDVSFIFDEIGGNDFKIAITESDGTTECKIELEKWDLPNEEAFMWVKVPNIAADVDTELYFYFDNDHADNVANVGVQQSAPGEAVWDANFKAVYHLIAQGANQQVFDSTNNDQDSTWNSADSTVLSKIDGGMDYDVGEFTSLRNSQNAAEGTLEAWVKWDLVDGNKRPIILDDGAGFLVLTLNQGADADNKIQLSAFDGVPNWAKSTTTPNVGQFYYITGVYKNGEVTRIYVNGTEEGQSAAAMTGPLGGVANALTIAKWGALWLDAVVDEVRVSNIRRTPSWIKASYETGEDDLIDYGIQENRIIPPVAPNLLFGGGFNSSSPYVELHWNHTLENAEFFEVQNSTDGISWTYLGQSTTSNYTDLNVVNGTERYYRVRACNFTGAWFNSSWTLTDYEEVYFEPVIGPETTVYENVTGEWVTYNLTEIVILVGIHDDGDVNSTLDIDGDVWNCSEIVAAPAYRISFNWTNVDPDAHCFWVVGYLYYDGTNNHVINIDLWNFTASAWDTVGQIEDMLGFEWVNVSIYDLRLPNDFISGSGEVRGRFDHVTNGNINDDIYIEYLKLNTFIPFESDARVTTVESDAPWIALAIILSIIAFLLATRIKR